MNKCTHNNRFGRFEVDANMLLDPANNKALRQALSQVVITKAEYVFHSNTINYVGISDEFDELKLGEAMPKYLIVVTTGDNGKVESVKWERLGE